MDKPRTTLGELLRSLRAQGLLSDAGIESIAKFMAEGGGERPLPWYLQALLGAGAWISAGCFLAFLGMAGILRDGTAMLPLGLILVAGATGLRRFSSHVFAAQFALALSVTGHGLLFGYVGEKTHGILAVAVAATVLSAALYTLYRDPLHRFLSVGSVIALWVAWIVERKMHHGLHLAVLLEVAALGLLYVRGRWAQALRPTAYAFALALPVTLSLHFFPDLRIQTPDWPSRIALGLGLLGLVVWTARKENLRREPAALALAATVLLGLFTAPGILAAMGLLVLGYARREGFLVGLGALSLAGFIVMFYYDLDINLGIKSAVMAGSGLVLLLSRTVLAKRPWARREAA
jgi:hypothetical protein